MSVNKKENKPAIKTPGSKAKKKEKATPTQACKWLHFLGSRQKGGYTKEKRDMHETIKHHEIQAE